MASHFYTINVNKKIIINNTVLIFEPQATKHLPFHTLKWQVGGVE